MKYSLSSYRFFIIVLLLLFFGKVNGQFINVDATSYTPQQLVADKFIGTQNLSCVSISNVTVSGGNLGAGNSSYGYFNKGTSNLGMNEGIILSTGNILAAPGPKTKPVQSATASGWTARRCRGPSPGSATWVRRPCRSPWRWRPRSWNAATACCSWGSGRA